MLACCIGVCGQEKKQATFVPPFDFPLTLSGNFGEIRSNHFHGGLDFKTGGVIGKPVRALADGYISRIRVTNGSGYVLDVCYHNGYSTINRHLSGFISPIAERVEKLQYENENWEVEIIPEPDSARISIWMCSKQNRGIISTRCLSLNQKSKIRVPRRPTELCFSHSLAKVWWMENSRSKRFFRTRSVRWKHGE